MVLESPQFDHAILEFGVENALFIFNSKFMTMITISIGNFEAGCSLVGADFCYKFIEISFNDQ